MQQIEGSEFVLPADLILLAMGFVGPRKAGMIAQSGVVLTERGNVDADTLRYEFTVDDPATWTKKWSASIPMATAMPISSSRTRTR